MAAARTPNALELDAGVHPVRRVSPPESPLVAVRARLDGRTALLVDAGDLDGWAGWRCAGAAHLLAPRDVIRRADGHDVVLDDATHAAEALFGRRARDRAEWARGELVTLVVAAARGVAEAIEAGAADEPGEWWLAADGRPVFAFRAEGGVDIVAVTRSLLRRASDACDDRVLRRCVDDLDGLLDAPLGLSRRLPDIESRMFDAAAPRAVELEAAPSSAGAAPRVIADLEPDDADGGFWRDVMSRHLDSRIGDLVGATLRPPVERMRALRAPHRDPSHAGRRSGRRGVVVAGAAAAVITVVIGLLWPDGASEDSAPRRAAASMPAVETPRPAPASAGGEDSGDPATAAMALLSESRADCAKGCGNAELVDDYGDVAVVRVAREGADVMYAVLERGDGGWSLRGVSDPHAPEGPVDQTSTGPSGR